MLSPKARRWAGSRGFSLAEFLTCVAVLLALAAVAGSYTWRARLRRDEAAAVASLRIINSAERIYYNTYARGFSETLANLGPPSGRAATAEAAGLLPADLASGKAHGYAFVYAPLGSVLTATANAHPRKRIRPSLYSVVAQPLIRRVTGVRSYYTDDSNVIRFSLTVAGPHSPPI